MESVRGSRERVHHTMHFLAPQSGNLPITCKPDKIPYITMLLSRRWASSEWFHHGVMVASFPAQATSHNRTGEEEDFERTRREGEVGFTGLLLAEPTGCH